MSSTPEVVWARAAQAAVVRNVLQERNAQDSKWGEQNHPDGTDPDDYGHLADQYRIDCDEAAKRGDVTWADILLEEVFEALAESDPQKLRTELIQSAAVIVNWVEAIDRRTA